MNRVEVRDTAAGTAIRINPMRWSNLPAALFVMFWLCGWAFGEVFVFITLFSAGTDWPLRIFLAVWLTFWTAGGISVVGMLIRLIGGTETIEIGRGLLRIRKGFVFFKTDRRYDLFGISDLHIRPEGEVKWNVLNSGFLEFQYGGKPVRFGNGLNPRERTELFLIFRGNKDFQDRHFRESRINPA